MTCNNIYHLLVCTIFSTGITIFTMGITIFTMSITIFTTDITIFTMGITIFTMGITIFTTGNKVITISLIAAGHTISQGRGSFVHASVEVRMDCILDSCKEQSYHIMTDTIDNNH